MTVDVSSYDSYFRREKHLVNPYALLRALDGAMTDIGVLYFGKLDSDYFVSINIFP